MNGQCNVTLENGVLVVRTPYEPGLVAQIKALPYSERKWDPKRKAWLVEPQHGQLIVGWCAAYLGQDIKLPRITQAAPKKETRLLEVRYIGTTKDRGNGERTAFGFVDGQWSAIFPEEVLRSWFEAGPATPDQATSLYAVLGVSQTASADEIKQGYRRMARQWHPDVCKELDATAVFQRINYAFEALNSPVKRGKYNAGLALQATLGRDTQYQLSQLAQGYRSPLRCGFVMAAGVEKMGRFVAEKIMLWEDIVLGGQTLVVSWQLGADAPLEIWI